MECPGQFGNYSLIRRLAVGGMAEIYLAKVAGLAGFEKFLVLKLIHPKFARDPEFIEMLVHEANLAVRLSHVNIAQVFDLGVHDERYFIAMEYVDGLDLYHFLRRLREVKRKMPFEVGAFIIAEVCSGLDYAHNRKDEDGEPLGIIHRDISPQNVLVSYDGDVKVIDFGIAKARARSQNTGVGVIKGKFFYMSPEQARGQQIDNRSDIFSVGVLFYELLTNRMLYDTESMRDALRLAKAASYLPPSAHREEIPAELEAMILKALSKERENRYSSAAELRSDLTTWLRKSSPGFGRHRLEHNIREVSRMTEERAIQKTERISLHEFPVLPQQSIILKRSIVEASGDLPAVQSSGARKADEATREIGPASRRLLDERRAARPSNAEEALARRVKKAREQAGWAMDSATDIETLDPDLLELDELSGEARYTADVFGKQTIVQPPAAEGLERLSSRFAGGPDGVASTLGTADPTPIARPSPLRRSRATTRPLSKQTPAKGNRNNASSPGRKPIGGLDLPGPFEASAGVSTEAASGSAEGPGFLRAEPDLESLEPPRDAQQAALDLPRLDAADNAPTTPFQRVLSPQEQGQVDASRKPVQPSHTSRRQEAKQTTKRPRAPATSKTKAHEGPVSEHTATLLWVVLAVLVAMAAGALAFVLVRSNQAETGRLRVESTPVSGAEILVDGVAVGGQTPAIVSGLSTGQSYQIRTRLPGYVDGVAENVQVEADVVSTLQLQMGRIRYSAEIRTLPQGATITLGGVVQDATTPTILNDLFLEDGAESLLISVSLDGYAPREIEVRWPDAQTHIQTEVQLEPVGP